MSTLHLVPADLRDRYDVKEWRNAAGILSTACPHEWQDIQDVLRGFRLLKSEIRVGGGNRSLISQRIDTAFYARGWEEKGFATSIIVDDNKFDSPTHAVDCLKGGVAVEMEWNNKDPFFDRDLNNFRLLFELRAIRSASSSPAHGNYRKFSSNSAKAPPTARPPRTTKDYGPKSRAAAAAAARS